MRLPMKMNRRNSSLCFNSLRQSGRCLLVICGCLVMVVFLLYECFQLRGDFGEIEDVATPSLRIHVSNMWVVKDDKYFTNKEYDDLLTSSLRSQQFEPSSLQTREPTDRTTWEEIIEGVDDYFDTAKLGYNYYSDVRETPDTERPETCQLPVHNILFLKTHYTGSDVITNILNRFADLRELLVALPNDGLSSFYWPSKFDWRYMDMRRLQGNLPQVLCNHARYNPDVMEKFMPFNTHYVTILRNPVHHFMTVFKKLAISERMRTAVSSNPLETFVLNPKKYLKEAIQQKRFFDSMNLLKNGMFFDLGLHTSDYDQEIAITSAILDLQKRFTLVLIHEYLDESLVLMKRKLCWDIDDVIYLRSAFPHLPSPDVTLSLHAREAISKWNKADWMLYKFFNATLWESIRTEEGFYSEMRDFKDRQKEVELHCSANIKESRSLDLVELNFTSKAKAKDVCEKMAMSQEDYLEYFRKKYLS